MMAFRSAAWTRGDGVKGLRMALVCLVLLAIPVVTLAESAGGRFFLMGDGALHIKNMHTNREVTARIIAPDGSFDEAGLSTIDAVFGYTGRGSGDHISLRLLCMLDYFSDLAAPGKMIHLISGYRSPDYNASLRDKGGNVAKTSIHMEGMALDFYIKGVSGKKLWELVRSKDCCGVGHYGGDSIHLDAARPRFWEASTSKVRTGESDFNRRIYASTEFDRYRPGDAVRLSLSAVSDFGFGIQTTVALVKDAEGTSAVATTVLRNPAEPSCVMIPDREAARSLSFQLPPNLQPGRYRIKIDYCRRPFEEMPTKTVSNEIEIAR
ncbi:MAG: YcbK family protein [Syntrophobacteraceae bacterium]